MTCTTRYLFIMTVRSVCCVFVCQLATGCRVRTCTTYMSTTGSVYGTSGGCSLWASDHQLSLALWQELWRTTGVLGQQLLACIQVAHVCMCAKSHKAQAHAQSTSVGAKHKSGRPAWTCHIASNCWAGAAAAGLCGGELLLLPQQYCWQHSSAASNSRLQVCWAAAESHRAAYAVDSQHMRCAEAAASADAQHTRIDIAACWGCCGRGQQLNDHAHAARWWHAGAGAGWDSN